MNAEEFNALADCKRSEKYRIYNTWRFLTLPEDRLPNNFAKMFPSELGNDIDFEYERIPLNTLQNFAREL
jgi:hypothetical protein